MVIDFAILDSRHANLEIDFTSAPIISIVILWDLTELKNDCLKY